MSDWLSYRLSDFLLFSPRTYYRLFELYNLAIWPAQILALALGAAILWLMHRGGTGKSRVVMAMLAAGWLWTAWGFLLERYDTINWAARYFAIGFAIQAGMLAWSAARGRIALKPHARWTGRIGLALFLFALAVYPLIAPLAGRNWRQAEIFGLAPDPTAIGTLGILLTAAGRSSRHLLFLPLVWCLVSGATLWTMDSPEAWVAPLAGLAALAVALAKRSGG